jgi:hypothetical protein
MQKHLPPSPAPLDICAHKGAKVRITAVSPIDACGCCKPATHVDVEHVDGAGATRRVYNVPVSELGAVARPKLPEADRPDPKEGDRVLYDGKVCTVGALMTGGMLALEQPLGHGPRVLRANKASVRVVDERTPLGPVPSPKFSPGDAVVRLNDNRPWYVHAAPERPDRYLLGTTPPSNTGAKLWRVADVVTANGPEGYASVLDATEDARAKGYKRGDMFADVSARWELVGISPVHGYSLLAADGRPGVAVRRHRISPSILASEYTPAQPADVQVNVQTTTTPAELVEAIAASEAIGDLLALGTGRTPRPPAMRNPGKLGDPAQVAEAVVAAAIDPVLAAAKADIAAGKGAKADSGKPRTDLLPPRALLALASVLGKGAVKYGDDNWHKVPGRRRRYLGAALRHTFAYMAGEVYDADTGEHHLACAMASLAFVVEGDLGNIPEVSE